MTLGLRVGDMWVNGIAIDGAIRAERPVLITYVAVDGEQTTRTIEPYEVAVTDAGNVIVRALDRRSGDFRSFRLDRITALSVLPGGFQVERPNPEALTRLRAEIAGVRSDGYGSTEARWSPGDPIFP